MNIFGFSSTVKIMVYSVRLNRRVSQLIFPKTWRGGNESVPAQASSSWWKDT